MHKGKFTMKSIICFLLPHLKLIVDINYIHSPTRILRAIVEAVLTAVGKPTFTRHKVYRNTKLKLKGKNKAGKCYIHLLFQPQVSVALWNFPKLCYRKDNEMMSSTERLNASSLERGHHGVHEHFPGLSSDMLLLKSFMIL